MFSVQVYGSLTTLRMASQTSFSGSMQAAKGSNSTYSHAIRKPMGQASRIRVKNQMIAHRSPGHRLPAPLPDPLAMVAMLTCLSARNQRQSSQYHSITMQIAIFLGASKYQLCVLLSSTWECDARFPIISHLLSICWNINSLGILQVHHIAHFKYIHLLN